MQRARSGLLWCIQILLAAIAGGGCSKDDIPTTPPSPFLFTDVAVSKFVSPPPTQVLHPGQSYMARFSVSYTLSPTDDAQRSTLEVTAQLNTHDANGNFVQALAVFPTPQVLTSPGGVLSDSIAFTVPAGVGYISVGAGIIARNGTLSGSGTIGPYWTVQ